MRTSWLCVSLNAVVISLAIAATSVAGGRDAGTAIESGGEDTGNSTVASQAPTHYLGLGFSSLAMSHTGMFQDEDAAEESVQASSDDDAAAELARKLQDPLANMKAVITDNKLLFGAGNRKLSFDFQIQPVYAIDFPDAGFSLVLRGVIPILGLASGAQLASIGDPLSDDDFDFGDDFDGGVLGGFADLAFDQLLGGGGGGSSSLTWGLGDIIAQFMFAPKMESAWKFGFGPQFSLRTRTDKRLAGPDWGAGPVGILVGSITEDISTAVIVGHLWSFDGDFSTTTLQPGLYYNFPDHPGVYLEYNGVITYDWKSKSSDALTLPLGGAIGQCFDLGGGYGLDLSIGGYWNVVKPDGAADWQIKFGVSLVLP